MSHSAGLSEDECFQSSEFMESLNDYISPWRHVITAALLTIYSVEGDDVLEDFYLSDKRGVLVEEEG